ncbi:MAG: AMP-binding protein [Odoribacteraceae bacterium]|jgi:fatty-acyl-CoA synthase|nr:AMP-binding protein [Odoribacteraceae bacterium]
MRNFSYCHGVSDIPLKGETIGENLRDIVEKYGDREALVVLEQGYRATYREFWDQTTVLAKGLMAYGIRRGDRVGIWAPNRYEWVLVQYATARVGAIMVNINPAYKTTGLRHALEQSRLDLLIAAARFRQTDYTDLLNRVRPLCKYPKRTIIIEQAWDNLLRASAKIDDQALAAREASLQFDDPVNIQYTSGTTGLPKGATLSHHNILNNGFFIGERMFYTERDRVCIPVPFYHCFGMVLGNMACTSHGACMVIVGESFEAEAVMRAVSAERCTSLLGVPTMFIAQLEHPNFHQYDFSSLRTGIMAGSSCPIETMRQVQSRMNMTQITICYGMTETSPVSSQSLADDDLERRVTTVGTVHPHVEVKIVDKEGAIVPRGEPGELCTRGYSVMLGYWDCPEETASIIDEQRWLHSGDIATMDDGGYIKITGRIKDLVIRGGENISPREVEEFLITHEAVADVYVIGVPSAKYGEEVMAWIKIREGHELTEAQIDRFCRGQIATCKIPRYWKFVDEFPMTISGKIRKVEMREISTRELGLENVARIETA